MNDETTALLLRNTISLALLFMSSAHAKKNKKGEERAHHHHAHGADADAAAPDGETQLERDAECEHCSRAVYTAVSIAAEENKKDEDDGGGGEHGGATDVQDKKDYYTGEWESCAKCDKPICGVCISQGKCGYLAIPDYAPPTVYIQEYCTRMRHRARHPHK
jgi:hypothetical protein